MTIILAYLLVSAAILLHELGHLLAARSVGLGVTEFSIGLGPKLFSTQVGMTRVSLRLVLFGGYVRFVTGPPDETQKLPQGRKTLAELGLLARIWVALAGPLANVTIAFLALVGTNYSLDAGSYGFEYRVVKLEGSTWAQVGDVLFQVNKKEEFTPEELYHELFLTTGPAVLFKVREGSERERQLSQWGWSGDREPYPEPKSTKQRIHALLGNFSLHGMRIGTRLVVKKADSFIAPVTCAARSVVALFEIQTHAMGILLLDPSEISRSIGGPVNMVANTNSNITTDPELWAKQAQASPVVGTQTGAKEPEPHGKTVYLPSLLAAFVVIHLGLAAFNMLPLFPLDGGVILIAVVELLSRPFGSRVQRTLKRLIIGVSALGMIYFLYILGCAVKNDLGMLWS